MPITKKLRLSINFTIEIADTPPLLPEGGLNPYDLEYDRRQARLLEKVKNNPTVFRRWIQMLIAEEMMKHSWYEWDDLLLGREISYEEILDPIIKTLSEEDQEFFQDRGELDFSDMAAMFLESFTITEESPVINETQDR